jgi:hypothetical protein
MRYHVTVELGAVVTINRTYEIEAGSEEEAKALIDSDEALELDDEDYFIVGDDVIVEMHSSEITPDSVERWTVKRVG